MSKESDMAIAQIDEPIRQKALRLWRSESMARGGAGGGSGLQYGRRACECQ